LNHDTTPLTTGGFVSNYPNIKLFFGTAGLGSVTGVVTSNDEPVEGVEILREGTSQRTLTNADGEYTLSFILPGTINLVVSKHGYLPHTTNDITIIADDATPHNISITPWSTVAVTGKVISSDTNLGLAGAMITLEGYEDYTNIMTDAQGAFTIPNVFTNNTYTLTISRNGYLTHTNDMIQVSTIPLAIDDIMLYEVPRRPFNLTAVNEGDQVVLNWFAPSNVDPVIMTHASDAFNTGIGTGGAVTFITAQRFTADQLSTLGVAGGFLTEVSFVPAQPNNAMYTIVIYSGGSATPSWNPGNIIYEQAIAREGLVAQAWNTISLMSDVRIPTTGEMWIGLRLVTSTGHPAAADHGPRVDGFGNLMFWNNAWSTMFQVGGDTANLNFNWLIRGTAEIMAGGGSRRLSMSSFNDTDIEIPHFDITQHQASRTSEGIIYMSTSGEYAPATTTNLGRESVSIMRSNTSRTRNTRALVGYQVYRANIDDLDDITLWKEFEEIVTGTTFVDETWADAEQGGYRYVIKAVYTNDNYSPAIFSNIVEVDMTSLVSVSIKTVDNTPISGATVRLVNNSGNPDHVYVQVATETGDVVDIPNVWLGTYTMTVTLGNFKPYINDAVVINTNPFEYAVFLNQIYILNEGFEGTTFPPEGWEIVDRDGDGHNWARTPGSATIQPNSGTAMASSRSWLPGPPEVLLNSNNWLITPPIYIAPNVETAKLRYFVRGTTAPYLDHYQILISTFGTYTGGDQTGPFVGDFEIVFQETVTAAWVEKEIDLGDFIGGEIHIAFRHYLSYDKEALFIDDVSVLITLPDETHDNEMTTIPIMTHLNANYPNPFNPTTTISFGLATEGDVSIEIFNIRGQRVKTLVNDHFNAGMHRAVWNGDDNNGRNVSSGIYFYRMKTDNFTETKRMLLMK
jgi:hypothetical protein